MGTFSSLTWTHFTFKADAAMHNESHVLNKVIYFYVLDSFSPHYRTCHLSFFFSFVVVFCRNLCQGLEEVGSMAGFI
jgi:hypothetical protein